MTANLSAQFENEIEQMILSFQKTPHEYQEGFLAKIYLKLAKADTAYAKAQMERLVSITSAYEEEDRIKVRINALYFAAYFGSSQEKLVKLKTAYRLAEKFEIYDFMARVKENTGNVFRELMYYDSAMICYLDAKYFYEESKKNDELVSVIHSIGDFYYHADLLDEAESAYKEILRLKGEPIAWKNFRYVVIKNNLGLIELKRTNYRKAIENFNASLNYKLSYKGGELDRNDSMHIAYIYMKLALSNLLLKNYPETKSYLEKSMRFTQSLHYTENLINLLIISGNLFYELSDYASSLKYLKDAGDLNSAHGDTYTKLELSSALANIYDKLGDYKNSLFWFKNYKQLSDSIALNKKAAASLQLKAEIENQRNLASISNLKEEKLLVIGVALFLIVSLSTTLIILIRLRKADKMLIDKNIEVVQIENKYQQTIEIVKENSLMHTSSQMHTSSPAHEIRDAEDVVEYDPSIQFVKIISRLEKIMIEKRLYSNPLLTLDELAHQVESNRSYLSKAINSVYKLNFSSYINMLRVKESIRLVTAVGGTPYTIEGLGREVGFNNRTSFIIAFKKYSGVTPSYFLKNIGKIYTEN